MEVEIVTLVMIEKDDHVLVQNRKLKYPGFSFPGGHVERGESFTECAIREIKEETGLTVSNLTLCGTVHWSHIDTDSRYLCMMYKTNEFEGDLVLSNREGDHIWMSLEELKNMDTSSFSSLPEIYALSPLLHETGRFNEVFIEQDDEDILNIMFY